MKQMTIRENIPAYMEELKAWLEKTADLPAEEMSDFFTARLEEYEPHMALWTEAYQEMPRLLPERMECLLDLGCGTGLELEHIFAHFPALSVTGIDLCPGMLDALRGKFPNRTLTLRCEDYFQADLGETRFDAAVSFETLHHFRPERKRELFRKLYAALKPGGIYLQTDYLACCEEEERLLFAEAERKRRLAGIPDQVFVHLDTPLTLEHECTLLRDAGFARVEPVSCINGAVTLRAVRE